MLVLNCHPSNVFETLIFSICFFRQGPASEISFKITSDVRIRTVDLSAPEEILHDKFKDRKYFMLVDPFDERANWRREVHIESNIGMYVYSITSIASNKFFLLMFFPFYIKITPNPIIIFSVQYMQSSGEVSSSLIYGCGHYAISYILISQRS